MKIFKIFGLFALTVCNFSGIAQKISTNSGWLGHKNFVALKYNQPLQAPSGKFVVTLGRSLSQGFALSAEYSSKSYSADIVSNFGSLSDGGMLTEMSHREWSIRPELYYRRTASTAPLGFYTFFHLGQSTYSGKVMVPSENDRFVIESKSINKRLFQFGIGGGIRRRVFDRVCLNVETRVVIPVLIEGNNYEAFRSFDLKHQVITMRAGLSFHF